MIAVGGGVAKLLVSCVDLDSLGNGPDRGDAALPGVDANSADAAPVDPCQHAVPLATSTLDDGPQELPTFVMAVDSVTLDPAKVAPLDLDGVCTCDGRPGGVLDGGPSCLAPMISCDGDGGADDNLGIVAAASTSITGFDTATNRLISAGHRSLLIQLAGYNGRANDPEVVVGALVAEGIRSSGCASSVFDPSAAVWSAGRCGDDPWSVSPASVVATGQLLPLVRGTGYVRDFQLFVRLNHAAELPFTDETSIAVQSPTLSGRLVPLGENLQPRDPASAPTTKEQRLFRIDDGVLTGRVLASDLLTTLGSYRQTATSTRLCASSAFGLIHQEICGQTDIPGSGDPPFDPTRPCDALSAAIGFVAIPAVTSYVTDAGAPSTGCESVDAGAFLCP